MSCIGIDVGYANAVIAIARRGGIDVLDNEVSKRSTAAMVGFLGKVCTPTPLCSCPDACVSAVLLLLCSIRSSQLLALVPSLCRTEPHRSVPPSGLPLPQQPSSRL